MCPPLFPSMASGGSFKSCDPGQYAEHHIRDLLDLSMQWLAAAHEENPAAKHPLFIWYSAHL